MTGAARVNKAKRMAASGFMRLLCCTPSACAGEVYTHAKFSLVEQSWSRTTAVAVNDEVREKRVERQIRMRASLDTTSRIGQRRSGRLSRAEHRHSRAAMRHV